MPNCFLLVEVSVPIDYWTAFVGCFDDNSILVFEILKSSPFFSRKVGKFGVVIEIIKVCEHHGTIF